MSEQGGAWDREKWKRFLAASKQACADWSAPSSGEGAELDRAVRWLCVAVAVYAGVVLGAAVWLGVLK